MPQEVEIPDGTVLEFPDDMSEVDMADAIYKNFPQFQPKAPQPKFEIAPEALPTKSPEEFTIRGMAFAKVTGTKPAGEEPPSGLEWMTKPLWEFVQKVNPQQFADAMDALSVSGAQAEGFIGPDEAQEAMAESSRTPTKIEAGLAGAQQAMAGAVNFFTSPLGIATLGTTGAPAAVQRTVAAAFTMDMARQYPKLVRELSEGIKGGDAEKIGRSLTGMGLNTAFIAKGLETTFGKGKAIDPTLTLKLREADAPLTAKQVEATAEGQMVKSLEQPSPATSARPAPEAKTLGPDWQVTVKPPERLGPDYEVPGFTQFDFIAEGKPGRSAVAQTLEKEGFTVPDFSKLPGGRYTWDEAIRLLDLLKPDVKLGIAPEGTGRLQKIIDLLMPRERGTPPPINPDVTTPIPDFQPREISKQIGSEPFGAGRLPVLGPLLDPRTRVRDMVDESLAAYHYERGVGRAISSALGEQLRGTIDKHFDVDPKTSQIRNIGTTQEGQLTHVSDVFEALQKDPKAYVLTAEQKAAFDQLSKLDADMRKLEDKYEIIQDAEGEMVVGKPTRKESYFPRIVIERPPRDVALLKGGGSVGAKQFFQKERLFETEAEGVAKGYRYEPSIEARVVTRVERLYKAITDKRLADDPALGAKTRQSVEAELRQAYAEELGAGTMTEQKLQQIVDSLETKGKVWQPAFYQKIFTAEVANKINQHFPNADSVFRRGFVNANNALKAIRLTLDLGVGQLQGLPTLYRNPGIWGKAQWNALKALVNPKVFPEYVRENLDVVREMAQMGSSVGRLEEMMAGTQRGEVMTRIPGIGKGFEAFGRQFQTFLDTAKVELWKAWRNITPREQWQSTMEAIEAQLNTGRMENIGVGRNRALAERAMFLAPSYYRGAVNLVAAIGERGVSGKVARQALGAYLAGGMITYVGLAFAMGMDEKEIVERLNPSRADFMMWSTKTETGRKFNVGFGGIYRSLLRLAGNVVKTSIDHPENWKSLSPDKNPFVRWYRGHAAPVPGMVWDQFSGKDFAGYETDMGTAVSSSVPMVLQQLQQKPGQPKPSAVDVGLSFVGMSAYPESLQLQFGREREDLAQKLFQKSYDDLSMVQSAKVTKEVQNMPAFQVKEPSTALQRERAFKADQDRVKRITEGLSESAQEKIKALGVKVAGYDPSFSAAGTSVPLTRPQQERYETLIIREYETAIGRLNTNALGRLPEKRRTEIVSQRLQNARLIARRKLFQK